MRFSLAGDPRRRRLVIAIAAGSLVLLAAAGVGIYGLITGPTPPASGTETTQPGAPTEAAASSPGSSAPTGSGPSWRLQQIVATSEPEVFARAVAAALFDWDTGTGLIPADYTAVLMAVGDPTGVEQPGLAADIAAYLPNPSAWIELRAYATTQHLDIERLFIPQAWAQALDQARPGQLAPGTVAYTVTGTRNRAGQWNGKPLTSRHQVAFTLFIACPPGYDTCHLLRLSRLDQPLQ